MNPSGFAQHVVQTEPLRLGDAPRVEDLTSHLAKPPAYGFTTSTS
jgi:hypothetical protein